MVESKRVLFGGVMASASIPVAIMKNTAITSDAINVPDNWKGTAAIQTKHTGGSMKADLLVSIDGDNFVTPEANGAIFAAKVAGGYVAAITSVPVKKIKVVLTETVNANDISLTVCQVCFL